MTKRDLNFIDKIVVHYSQTPIGREVSLEEMREWHLQRGMSDIAYHFIIHLDGSISYGRPLNVSGAHARGHNLKSIGVCYVGGTIEGGQDTRTDLQKATLHNLLSGLIISLPNITQIIGHNDVSDKECPGFDAKEFYNYLLC